MKKAIIAIILFATIQCKAQSNIVDIYNWDGREAANVYYKDLNNYLNSFVGTWLFANGSTSLKINIIKLEKYNNLDYYEDFLIGEYQYVEKGIEKINTIQQLNTVMPNQWGHQISGNFILDNQDPPICIDCLSNEKRVKLGFSDPIRLLGGELILQNITVNGKPALKAYKRTTIYAISLDEISPYKEMFVPDGEYILIKQ